MTLSVSNSRVTPAQLFFCQQELHRAHLASAQLNGIRTRGTVRCELQLIRVCYNVHVIDR
jgi:hypothetical protein